MCAYARVRAYAHCGYARICGYACVHMCEIRTRVCAYVCTCVRTCTCGCASVHELTGNHGLAGLAAAVGVGQGGTEHEWNHQACQEHLDPEHWKSSWGVLGVATPKLPWALPSSPAVSPARHLLCLQPQAAAQGSGQLQRVLLQGRGVRARTGAVRAA